MFKVIQYQYLAAVLAAALTITISTRSNIANAIAVIPNPLLAISIPSKAIILKAERKIEIASTISIEM